jgi:hypothetical protein
LEGKGVSCWLAPRNIPAGAAWDDCVSDGIQQCRVMIVVVSQNSNDADGLKDEVQQGLDLKKPIIPVRIDDTGAQGGLALKLKRRQWVDARGESQQVFDELHQLLDGHLRRRRTRPRPASPDPAPPAKPVTAGEESRTAPAAAAAVDIPNPYRFDATATPDTFKGRDRELDDLIDSIETGTHTAIFGLQRMGKSSLFEEGLRERLAAAPKIARTVLLAKIDLQTLGDDEVTYRDLLYAIVKSLSDAAAGLGIGRNGADLRGLTHELFASGRFSRGERAELFAVFSTILRGFAATTGRRIVLFIDEFSEVRKVIERNKQLNAKNPRRNRNLFPHEMFLDPPFMHHLSALLKDSDNKEVFTLIVAVRPFMAEFDSKEELQILKLMKPIMLYYLDERAAKELITDPLHGLIAYEEGAVDYLWRLTAGHPYLLQFMLRGLVSKARRNEQSTITLQDIRDFEQRMISEGPAYDAQFRVLTSDYSVDEVTHKEEARLGVGAMALISKYGHEQSEGWVKQEQVFDALAAHKIPKAKAASLLSQFQRSHIVEEKEWNGGLYFRMAIPLLRKRFVQQNLFIKYFS